MLRLEGDAARLRVKAEAATRVTRAKAIAHEACVDSPRGAELGDFLEQVVVRGEEERETGSKVVDGQSCVDGPADVLHGIRERERKLLHRRGAGLADVIAGDRDGVPAGDLSGAEAEEFRDERQRRRGRIDVRAPRDVLLENVVLDGAAERTAGNAAFFGDHHIHGQQRGGGRVDGHAGGHCVERDAVEQGMHVLHRVDRYAHPADFAERARRIGVDAHLGGQVERHRQARLSLLQEQAEAGIGLVRRAEARVLPHRPQSSAIHAGLHAACVREAAGIAEVALVVQRRGTVDGIDGDSGGALRVVSHARKLTPQSVGQSDTHCACGARSSVRLSDRQTVVAQA